MSHRNHYSMLNILFGKCMFLQRNKDEIVLDFNATNGTKIAQFKISRVHQTSVARTRLNGCHTQDMCPILPKLVLGFEEEAVAVVDQKKKVKAVRLKKEGRRRRTSGGGEEMKTRN
uniref:Uncharacterized protein n=1 Tax=Gossypium raimondii TaxID=29730 RepID=A0A0D2QHX3_GOSRA|nr:hypothetical protein B456_002G233000 [Gossypium raimondii]